MQIVIIYSIVVTIAFIFWLGYIIRVYDQNYRNKE